MNLEFLVNFLSTIGFSIMKNSLITNNLIDRSTFDIISKYCRKEEKNF